MEKPQKKKPIPSPDQLLLLRILRGGPMSTEELCHCRDNGLVIDDGGEWVLSTKGLGLVSPR